LEKRIEMRGLHSRILLSAQHKRQNGMRDKLLPEQQYCISVVPDWFGLFQL
jgi:hypothetical protein